MSKTGRVALAALIATAILGALVGKASANRLSFSSATFRVTWSPLRVTDNNGASITCPITLEGSFHSRTIAKTGGALIGHVTRALDDCFDVALLTATLPWHVQYERFTGRLPAITGIGMKIINFSFRWEDFLACLFRAGAEQPLVLMADRDTSTTQITGLHPLEILTIGSTGFFCSAYTASLSGLGIVNVLAGGAGIFATLI